ncbi:MAG: winged helix-turn-helix domain-containing protein [Halobacteriales archaeon]|nr:winged helix-turn-helix domain-containing protein [Halobacteriales archaeon]
MATVEHLTPTPDPESDPDPAYRSLDEAGPMLEALTSEGARKIMATLDREPASPTAIAEEVGTSLQNVSYHLTRLEEVGLVTVVGTRYSKKGHEMNVYAPAITSLVITDLTTADHPRQGDDAGRAGD